MKRIATEYFKYQEEEKLKELNEELNPTTTQGSTVTVMDVEVNEENESIPLGGTTETTIVVEETPKKRGRKKKE